MIQNKENCASYITVLFGRNALSLYFMKNGACYVQCFAKDSQWKKKIEKKQINDRERHTV